MPEGQVMRRLHPDCRFGKCGVEIPFGISRLECDGRRRSLPCAFTEQGVAMLSSVLRSEDAVRVNVAIMPRQRPAGFTELTSGVSQVSLRP